MTNWCATIALGLLAVGCGATRPNPAAKPAANAVAHSTTPAPDTFALIWFDAKFYTGLDAPAPTRAYDFGGTPRSQRPGHFFVMRVLESRGAWLRVIDPVKWLRPDDTSRHCMGSGVFWMKHFAIQLWVHKSDLVPVLNKAFTRRYEDGTFVSLLPGTPIVDEHPWAKGYHFPITVPAGSIGGGYQPAPALAGPREREGYSFMQGQPEAFALGGAEVPWLMEITNYSKLPYFHASADHSRAYETNGCGAFELTYRGTVSSAPMVGVYGMAGSGSNKVPGIQIPKGTPLIWPYGGPAGIVAETFTQAGARRSPGPLTCLKVPFGTKLRTTGYLASTVTVCVKSNAVRQLQTNPRPPKGIRSADNAVEVLR